MLGFGWLVGCGGGHSGASGSGGSSGAGPTTGPTTGSTTGTVPDVPPDLPVPGCGNGIVEPPELCDDGNTVDGDGCEGDCTYPSYTGEGLYAGYSCTCVKFPDGRLRCWGASGCPRDSAEIYGDDEPAALAGDIVSTEPVVQLAAARLGGCAVMESGDVRCWNPGEIFLEVGQDATLGQGTPEEKEVASSLADSYVIPLPGPARQVAFGNYHGCAVLEDGALYCWGYNGSGQLGLGHTETVGDDETPLEAGPVDVGGKVLEVSIGIEGMHTCALLEGGAVRCFGAQVEDPYVCGWDVPTEDCNNTGALGTGVRENIGDDEVPANWPPVDIGGPAVQVGTILSVSCALREDGALYCWGPLNLQSGSDLIGDDESPVMGGAMKAPVPARRFSLGSGGLCVEGMQVGQWWCAGYVFLILGYNMTFEEAMPMHEVWGQPLRSVVSGESHLCFLLEDHSVRCIGTNRFGSLGYGDIPGDPRFVCSFGCMSDPREPAECCKGDDEPLSELPPVPYE